MESGKWMEQGSASTVTRSRTPLPCWRTKNKESQLLRHQGTFGTMRKNQPGGGGGRKKAKPNLVERQHDLPGQRKPQTKPHMVLLRHAIVGDGAVLPGRKNNEGHEHHAATTGASK